MGPGKPTRTALALAPRFQTVPGGPVVQLATARVLVFRVPRAEGATPVADVTGTFSGNADLTLDITVPVLGGTEEFLYEIRAMDAAGNVIYFATDSVTVIAGSVPSAPEEVVLHWATADTLVRSLRVLPEDTVITANEPFQFHVIAKKADSSVVVASVGWVSRDESKLQMDQASGTATALTAFSNVWIVATMGTGLQDSTLVSATQPVVSVVVSPPSANLFVAGTQQLAAAVAAAGNLPLPTRPVHWTSSNTAVATVSSTGLVTAVAVGNTTISATSGGVTGTSAITVARKIPTIVWPTPADITFGTALSATQLNANAVFDAASVSGTFVYVPPAGTVLSAGARPLGVTFTPADPAVFGNATGGVSINVLKASQTITFAALPDRVFGEADFTVSATASSGLAVTFAASGICTVTGTTVRLTGAGSCTITASQGGDANRNAAPDVARTFTVNRATVAISAGAATGIYGGTTTLSATLMTGGAGLAAQTIAFSLNGTVVASATTDASGVATATAVSLAGINVGTYSGAITPASGVLASFAGDGNFSAASAVNTLIVTSATATLALGPLTFTYDGTPKPVTVTVTPAGLTVIAVTYNGVAEPPTQAGSYSVVASLTNPNYQAANAVGTLIIAQASQTIAFAALPNRKLGDPDFTVSATASSGLPVSFSAAGGGCTITGAVVSLIAEGTCTITASQSGDANRLAAPDVAQTFTVEPRPVFSVNIKPLSAMVQTNQTVLFVATPKDVNGNELFGRQVDWTTGDIAIATVSGGVVTGVSAGQTTVTATVEGKSATATVDVQLPPPPITSTTLAPSSGDTLYSIGAKRLLVAQSFLGSGQQVAGSYTWASSNPAAISVDNFGQLTAIANGSASITVTEAGGTADTVALVVAQKLAKIAITPNLLQLTLGATATLTASGYDALGTPMALTQQVIWSPLDQFTTVLSVDSITGVVTGLNLGNSTVVARSGALEARALVEVSTVVKRVVITATQGTAYNALGQTLGFTATAYDFKDAVLPGFQVDWESLNESVVRLTSIDGATATATSYTNGTATLRARVQGVAGDVALVVQQQLARIEVSPATVTLDVGGVAVLTALGYDANNRAMILAPGAINWQSVNLNVATVDPASGVVTAVAPDPSPVAINANAGAVSGSASVTVQSAALGQISFGTTALSIGSGQTVPVKIYLNRPPPQSPFVVNLSVADGIARFTTPSVSFIGGATEATATLIGDFAGTTTISAADLRDVTGAFMSATTTLSVQPGVEISFWDNEMFVGESYATQVHLTEPAPAGGSWVQFQYSVAGAVRAEPSPAFVPAGQLAADVVLRATGAGTTTVTPVIPGGASTPTPAIVVHPAVLTVDLPDSVRRIGAGQFDFGGKFRPPVEIILVDGGLRGPNRGAPARNGTPGAANARIPTAPGQWADGYFGYSCSGNFLVDGPPSNIGYVPAPDFCLRIATRTQNPLPVALSSSNQSVALVESEVTMAGFTEAFGVHGVAPGLATITAGSSGWTPVTIPLQVTTPRLSAYGYGTYGINNPMLRDSGSISLDISVGDSLGYEHPLVNSLRVRLTSSDPAIFRAKDSVAVIAAGTSYSYGPVSLVPVAAGTAWLRVTSDGHFADSVQIDVPARRLVADRVVLVGAGQTRTTNVETGRIEPTAVDVTVTSLTDTLLAAVDPTGQILSGGTLALGVRGFAAGSTSFLISAPGFATETLTVVVTSPRLLLSYVLPVNVAETVLAYLSVGDSTEMTHLPRDLVGVSLRAVDPAIVGVDSTASVPAGQWNITYSLSGRAPGMTQVIAEAPGYLPDTLDVPVVRRALQIWNQFARIGVSERVPSYADPAVTMPIPAAGDSVVLLITQKHPERARLSWMRSVVNSVNYESARRFGVAGVAPGVDTVIVRDSAGTYAPDTLIYEVVPSKFSIPGDYNNTVSLSVSPSLVRYVELPGAWAYTGAVGGRLVARLISTDTTVVVPTTQYAVGIDGSYSIYTAFTLLRTGTASIIVQDSAGAVLPDTIQLNVVGSRLLTSNAVVSTGIRQRTGPFGGTVSLEQALATDLTVRLSSSDPTVATVPDSIVISAGFFSANFEITGRDTTGTVRIRMDAVNFLSAYLEVEVGRPRIFVGVLDWEYANRKSPITVIAKDHRGFDRIVTEPVTVALSSSAPGIAAPDSTQVTIGIGQSSHALASMSYLAKGNAIFTARDARYPALIGYRPYVDTIQVQSPQFTSVPEYGDLGLAQVDTMIVYVTAPVPASVTMTLSSDNPAIASVQPTIVIPAGDSVAKVPVFGRGVGTTTVRASAPGYKPATFAAYVAKGGLGWSNAIPFTVGDTTSVQLITNRPVISWYSWQPLVVGSTQTLLLSGTNVKFFAVGSATEITSVTVDSGTSISQAFRVTAIGTGPASITVTNPNFEITSYNGTAAYPATANVSANGVTSFSPTPVDIGVGGTVYFSNATGVGHNVTFATAPTQTIDPLVNGTTVARTFSVPGSFSYQCTIHTVMTGTVVVH